MTPSRLSAALAGIAAGALGLGLAQALSALFGAGTSPLIALGDRTVDLTPAPLKEWAIDTFGTADKAILIGSMLVVSTLLLALVGLLGARDRRLGIGALVILGAVTAAAVLGDRSEDTTPTLAVVALGIGLLVGGVALWWMLGKLRAGEVVRDVSGDSEAKSPLKRPGLPGQPERPEQPDGFDRRRFLAIAGGMTAVGVAAGVGIPALKPGTTGRSSVVLPTAGDAAPPLPRGVDLNIDGLTPHIVPNRDFYRIDIALSPPRLNVEDYRLTIKGLVDQPVELTYEDILDLPLVERRVTLACVSNPVGGSYVGNATWLGVPMTDVLDLAGVQADADAVLSSAADGITIGTPLEALTDGRDALLAIGMNGDPLPVDHGFPVRMVVPGLYGYVSATKWLTELEVSRFEDFQAYWTQRGWAAEGPIKTATRIDVPGDDVAAGRVTVAGVSWAQHRGITGVEVRVDDGPWLEAELAPEDTIDTWRQWRLDWDAEPGTYRLQARATDGDGETQTGEEVPPTPDGATGWPTVEVTVT